MSAALGPRSRGAIALHSARLKLSSLDWTTRAVPLGKAAAAADERLCRTGMLGIRAAVSAGPRAGFGRRGWPGDAGTTPIPPATTQPKYDDQGPFYGWGSESADGPTGQRLNSAAVAVIAEDTDVYGGRTIATIGVTGAGRHGDSGGPMLVNGRQVGVAATVLNHNGSNPQGYTDFADVTANRPWIRTTAGV